MNETHATTDAISLLPRQMVDGDFFLLQPNPRILISLTPSTQKRQLK